MPVDFLEYVLWGAQSKILTESTKIIREDSVKMLEMKGIELEAKT